jgi:hypothetical protein
MRGRSARRRSPQLHPCRHARPDRQPDGAQRAPVQGEAAEAPAPAGIPSRAAGSARTAPSASNPAPPRSYPHGRVAGRRLGVAQREEGRREEARRGGGQQPDRVADQGEVDEQGVVAVELPRLVQRRDDHVAQEEEGDDGGDDVEGDAAAPPASGCGAPPPPRCAAATAPAAPPQPPTSRRGRPGGCRASARTRSPPRRRPPESWRAPCPRSRSAARRRARGSRGRRCGSPRAPRQIRVPHAIFSERSRRSTHGSWIRNWRNPPTSAPHESATTSRSGPMRPPSRKSVAIIAAFQSTGAT